jgi:hypothetical protein
LPLFISFRKFFDEFKWSPHNLPGSIMSSIDSLSSAIYVPPSRLTQGVQSPQGGGADSDGDGDGGQNVRKSGGHGHGQMQNALMQALQILGLAAPTSPAAPSSTSSTTGTSGTTQSSSATDSDGDSDGSTSAVDSTKSDIRKFMHALFQAVKGESSSGSNPSTNTSGATDPKANFASGLSALISQVSNGQAPSDLQSAFAQVMTDLQGSGSTSTSSTGTTSSPQVTLQALLSQMQQNLGYGAASKTSAIGNIVSEHA